ncbi:MAG TPA: heme-binding protein [Chloroflexota bacterium]|nr:heme-binding protein [Chloroflexota bacterium]
MSKRTWALITLSQTTLLALGLAFVTARGGAAAPSPAPAPADRPASVAAQEAPPPDFVPTITRAEARAIIDAAIPKAQELHGTMTVVVLDAGGNLVSLDRMDGRGPTWDTFAIGKAMGALSSRRPTRDFPQLMNDRPDRYFGTLATLGREVYMVNGGQPLVVDGHIVGAVGVAGLGPGEDDMAAEAGIAAWQAMRPTVRR